MHPAQWYNSCFIYVTYKGHILKNTQLLIVYNIRKATRNLHRLWKFIVPFGATQTIFCRYIVGDV